MASRIFSPVWAGVVFEIRQGLDPFAQIDEINPARVRVRVGFVQGNGDVQGVRPLKGHGFS
jgi:hypothetical protein